MSTNNEEVVEDYLQVDKPIPGQNFVCLSVVNPEKVLKKKEEYLFYNYYKLKIQEHIQRLESNMKSLLEKKNEETNTIHIKDLLHLKNNMHKGFEIDTKNFDEFKEKYEDFMFTKSIEVGNEFDSNNKFQTSVRGIKVRGVYDTYEQAEIRAKSLQKNDSSFDVFVGQVGYWLPLITDTNHVEKNEYANEELNNLVKCYEENQAQKDIFYQERTREMKEDAARRIKEDKDKKLKKIEENDENDLLKETVDSISNEDPWLSRQSSN